MNYHSHVKSKVPWQLPKVPRGTKHYWKYNEVENCFQEEYGINREKTIAAALVYRWSRYPVPEEQFIK